MRINILAEVHKAKDSHPYFTCGLNDYGVTAVATFKDIEIKVYYAHPKGGVAYQLRIAGFDSYNNSGPIKNTDTLTDALDEAMRNVKMQVMNACKDITSLLESVKEIVKLGEKNGNL